MMTFVRLRAGCLFSLASRREPVGRLGIRGFSFLKDLFRVLLQEIPYLAPQMDEEAQPSQGYYLRPVDDAGFREPKRLVKSPVQTPTSDTNESPKFEHAVNVDLFG